MTTIDRDELRFDAEAHLQYGGGGDDLAYGVLALLDALTRAEAQSETRRQQAAYWQERAEGFEARIQAVRDVCDRALAVKVQGSTDTDVAMAAAGATILRALDGDA